jgi:hypothetical protein
MSLISVLHSIPKLTDSLFSQEEVESRQLRLKHIKTKGDLATSGIVHVNNNMSKYFNNLFTSELLASTDDTFPAVSQADFQNSKYLQEKINDNILKKDYESFLPIFYYEQIHELCLDPLFVELNNLDLSINDMITHFPCIVNRGIYLYLFVNNFPQYLNDFIEYVINSINTVVPDSSWIMILMGYVGLKQTFVKDDGDDELYADVHDKVNSYNKCMTYINTFNNVHMDNLFQYLPVCAIEFWMKELMTPESYCVPAKYGKEYLKLFSTNEQMEILHKYPEVFKDIITNMHFSCTDITQLIKLKETILTTEFITDNISKFHLDTLSLLLNTKITDDIINLIRDELIKRGDDITKQWRTLSYQTKLEIASDFYQIEDNEQVIVYVNVNSDFVNVLSNESWDNSLTIGSTVDLTYATLFPNSDLKYGVNTVPIYKAIKLISDGHSIAEYLVNIKDIFIDPTTGSGTFIKGELSGYNMLSTMITEYNKIPKLSSKYKITKYNSNTINTVMNIHSTHENNLPTLVEELLRLKAENMDYSDLNNNMVSQVDFKSHYDENELIKTLITYIKQLTSGNASIKLMAFIEYSNLLMNYGNFLLENPSHLSSYLGKLDELTLYFPILCHYHDLIYQKFPAYVKCHKIYNKSIKLRNILGLHVEITEYNTKNVSDDDAILSSDDNFEITDDVITYDKIRELTNDLMVLNKTSNIKTKLVILKNICNQYLSQGSIFKDHLNIVNHIYQLLKSNVNEVPFALKYINIIDEYRSKISPKNKPYPVTTEQVYDSISTPPSIPFIHKTFTFSPAILNIDNFYTDNNTDNSNTYDSDIDDNDISDIDIMDNNISDIIIDGGNTVSHDILTIQIEDPIMKLNESTKEEIVSIPVTCFISDDDDSFSDSILDDVYTGEFKHSVSKSPEPNKQSKYYLDSGTANNLVKPPPKYTKPLPKYTKPPSKYTKPLPKYTKPLVKKSLYEKPLTKKPLVKKPLTKKPLVKKPSVKYEYSDFSEESFSDDDSL